ncbi:FG-GAP repeat domain-containing protein [Verrucomicrobiota bacterium sgz303538]
MVSRIATVFFLLAAGVAAQSPEPKFKAVTIDDRIQIGYGLAIADVDGDKLPDILLADKKQFVWYRNPGAEKSREAGAWQKYVIAENLTAKDNVCIAAQDIDGDGKCEIAVGAEWNPSDTENSGAVFYLVPPTDRTQRWQAVKLHAEPTTHRMRWVKTGTGSGHTQWSLAVVPLHGRGNTNGAGAAVRVLLYQPPTDLNDPKGEWKTELLDESMHMTHNFDIRRTVGAVDTIVLAGKEGFVTLPLARDQRTKRSVSWPENFQGAGEIRFGKLAGGRDYFAAVEPMHGNRLVAYVPANDSSPGMRSVVLADKLIEGHALACGDLIGMGADQIVVGSRGNPQQPRPVGIKIFTALDATGEKWKEGVVDENEMACEDLQLADLDADGHLDIIAAGRSTRNVKVYWNETTR